MSKLQKLQTCYLLFLLSAHIKEVSSKNTLRMLIFYSLPSLLMALVQEVRRREEKGVLGLLRYSGQSLTLIHIHSSSVPHVCPALKKANNGYPSLSSRSPLSTHYPSSIAHTPSISASISHTYLFVCFRVKQRSVNKVNRTNFAETPT